MGIKKIKLKRLWNNLASVRSNIIQEALKNNDTIEITVVGMSGRMLLSPDVMKAKSFQAVDQDFESKFVKGMKYSLIDFAWGPEKE